MQTLDSLVTNGARDDGSKRDAYVMGEVLGWRGIWLSEDAVVASLAKSVERNQVWSRTAAKYGVENPVPPWKASLEGICDALDRSDRGARLLGFVDRRDEENALSPTVSSKLPYPGEPIGRIGLLARAARHPRRGRTRGKTGRRAGAAAVLSEVVNSSPWTSFRGMGSDTLSWQQRWLHDTGRQHRRGTLSHPPGASQQDDA